MRWWRRRWWSRWRWRRRRRRCRLWRRSRRRRRGGGCSWWQRGRRRQERWRRRRGRRRFWKHGATPPLLAIAFKVTSSQLPRAGQPPVHGPRADPAARLARRCHLRNCLFARGRGRTPRKAGCATVAKEAAAESTHNCAAAVDAPLNPLATPSRQAMNDGGRGARRRRGVGREWGGRRRRRRRRWGRRRCGRWRHERAEPSSFAEAHELTFSVPSIRIWQSIHRPHANPAAPSHTHLHGQLGDRLLT